MIKIEQQTISLSEKIIIDAGQSLGATAGVLVREKARQLPEYNWPLETWQVGQDRDFNPIAIDTLGLWLFGVPGAEAHCRIVAQEQQIIIFYPPAPAEVRELLTHLKQVIETEGI